MRALCPNCYQRVKEHPQNGCVLAALLSVVRDRGDLSQEQLEAIHASANPDAIWDDLGPIVDRLEEGGYDKAHWKE